MRSTTKYDKMTRKTKYKGVRTRRPSIDDAATVYNATMHTFNAQTPPVRYLRFLLSTSSGARPTPRVS
eukprot:4477918-Amphidinium_carterae.1